MKKITALLLVIIMFGGVLLTSCGADKKTDDTEKVPDGTTESTDNGAGNNTEQDNEAENVTASVGDVIRFGHYEQDNNTSNGSEKIEWLVLEKDNDKIFVVSKYALDCQPFHSSRTNVTWETCSLRKWLNDTFLHTAFSSEEADCIIRATVPADPNPNYATLPGNPTTDQVFLLSISEVNRYFSSDGARICALTEHAVAQGAGTSSTYVADGKAACLWWLRTPGEESDYASFVYEDGAVVDYGFPVRFDNEELSVRPAIWIASSYLVSLDKEDVVLSDVESVEDVAGSYSEAAEEDGPQDPGKRGAASLEEIKSMFSPGNGTSLFDESEYGIGHAKTMGTILVIKVLTKNETVENPDFSNYLNRDYKALKNQLFEAILLEDWKAHSCVPMFTEFDPIEDPAILEELKYALIEDVEQYGVDTNDPSAVIEAMIADNQAERILSYQFNINIPAITLKTAQDVFRSMLWEHLGITRAWYAIGGYVHDSEYYTVDEENDSFIVFESNGRYFWLWPMLLDY